MLFLLANLFQTVFVHADVTGTVTIQGTPKSKDQTFVAAASGCGGSRVRTTENWKIGPKGELADVVVWIVDPREISTLKSVPPPKEIMLKQLGCRYEPHVAAVQAGVPFKIINGDPTLHNVRAVAYNGPGKPRGGTLFNFGQTYQGQSDERQFDQPSIVTMECNVHSWMQGWVRVIPHRYFAVSATDGTFAVSAGALADGDYKIDAWHSRFAQPLEQPLKVKNGVAIINFQFDGAQSF